MHATEEGRVTRLGSRLDRRALSLHDVLGRWGRRVGPSLAGSRRWYLWFIAPLTVAILCTSVVPMAILLYFSFTGESSAYFTRPFAGLKEYAYVISDPAFLETIRVEVLFVVASLALEMTFGFAIALALRRYTWFSRAVRTLLVAPVVMPVVVVALLFSFMLQPGLGLVADLGSLLGLNSAAWLSNGTSALAVLVGIDVWQYTPFVAILLYAGLQGIPPEVLDAAAVDGAGPVRLVRFIYWPMLLPVTLVVGLLRFVDAVQVFPTIYVLTSGGPGESTTALNYWGYLLFFVDQYTGRGSAAVVILMVGTLVIAGIILWIGLRKFRGLGGGAT